jgi:hypothetical protein
MTTLSSSSCPAGVVRQHGIPLHVLQGLYDNTIILFMSCRGCTTTRSSSSCPAGVVRQHYHPLHVMQGLYDNTIILFMSDNGGPTEGGSFNWPLRGKKATLWEGGTRSFTIFSAPGLPASSRGTTWPGNALTRVKERTSKEDSLRSVRKSSQTWQNAISFRPCNRPSQIVTSFYRGKEGAS